MSVARSAAAWLERSDALDASGRRWSPRWSPLHHVEVLSAERTRALLRGGASIHAPAGTPPVSPLQRAQQQQPAGEAAQLILRAAQPWSPATHDLFPAAARARAVELCRLGYLLGCSERFQTESRSLIDAWCHRPDGGSVLAAAVTRDYYRWRCGMVA